MTTMPTGPLSFNQEFLSLFDQGSEAGPFGPRYHIVHGWRLRGPLDVDLLRDSLDRLVDRHEALRTTLVRTGDEAYQQVNPTSSPQLDVHDLPELSEEQRAAAAEQWLNDVESGTITVDELPHLRGILLRFDESDALLIFMFHHLASDGFSVRVLLRDLTRIYAAGRGLGEADLPPMYQYREFAEWQRSQLNNARAGRSLVYWKSTLDGAEITTLQTDHLKSAGLPAVTGVHRFTIGADVVRQAGAVAKRSRCSPFMVYFGAYQAFLRQVTGRTDIVAPTFSPGRANGRFDETVGSFFNFLPIRADLSGAQTFRDVLAAVRTSCLGAYANDLPAMQVFGAAPALMAPAMQDDQSPFVFQVFPFPHLLDRTQVGDLEYTELRRRLVSQPVGSDVPDGGLWTLNLDPSGDIVGSLQYRSNVFDEGTIAGLVQRYSDVLAAAVADPDAALG